MQPMPVQPRIIAGQDPNRLAAALSSRSSQSRCQRGQVAAKDRVVAQLLRARQQQPDPPLGYAQFKHNVHRAILSQGGCADVIEIRHLGPPRLDRVDNQSYLSATRRP